ncbi:mediator of RNA polymerase II transcription subunit 27 isoform X1 [Cebus imitator]|uniref:mediator of RNA polymerase II transcription subunit 27 isoform X1 n=1 Tax=Cebus imitator TaxID=2715852 RepID=UPI00189B9A68|nr:mediator of RNA polymerase II transcription subunit 27 isoform X1 [Cebus imitator]
MCIFFPPRYVDDVISRIDRMFPEMSIHLSRPNGASAMLLVTLGKVLKVIVVMRSLFIDRTIVKGYHENVYTEDGKLDIWSKSNYQVFQKLRPPGAWSSATGIRNQQWRSWEARRENTASDRPRHHCPAPLPAAPDAGCCGQILHDLVKELHKAIPGPVPALREVSAGRPSPDMEGFPNP